MKRVGLASVAVIATSLLVSCDAPAAATFESVTVVARPNDDRDRFDLAAGIAEEVSHNLSRHPEIVVRPRPADIVIWVSVEGLINRSVVRYEIETSNGPLRPPTTLAASSDDLLFPVPRRIAADALKAMNRPALDAAKVPDWPAPSSAAAYAGFLRAMSQSPSKKEAERVAMFEPLSASLQNYPPAALELGRAYLDLAGKSAGTDPYYDKAEKTLRHAFQLDARYPPARALLASYFAKHGQSEESVKMLQEGLVSHPKFPGFYDQLGYVMRYAGLMERSMENYRRYQALDQSTESLIASQDQITKSLIYLGRYSEALSSHERMESFVNRQGRSPDEKEWFYKGVIHLYAGSRDHALDAFRRGQAVDASTVWSTFGRGYAGMARGDRREVAKVLDELERLVVVDGERHYRLVHFASFIEQPERAIKHLAASIRGGFFNAPYIASDPFTKWLRSQPGFAPVLREAETRHTAFKAIVTANPN